MNKQPVKPEPDTRDAALNDRRPYRPPTLVEYGPVAKLTQNMNGSGADGGPSATMMRSCL